MRQVDGGGAHIERPGHILHYCFGTSKKDYLIRTLGAGTREDFLEEVLFRLVQHQEWISQMKGCGGVEEEAVCPEPRARDGVYPGCWQTWLLQQRGAQVST